MRDRHSGRVRVPDRPEAYRFNTSLRVRFAETDAQGVVYNANYLVYFEVGRVEYLRQLFGDDFFSADRPYAVTVAEAHCRFISSARFDQALHIHSRIPRFGQSSYRFEYLIRNPARDRTVALGYTTMVTLDRQTMRPIRVPRPFVERVTAFEEISVLPPPSPGETE
ncbi:MAG: acyl-CoA thioesterase [Nitrospirae bacterium]|nr:acyl-CoA thioesterase [Nitrospirota bacterium]